MSSLSVGTLLNDITRQQQYNELQTFVKDIAAGSKDEDGFLGERGVVHFYSPATGAGLYGGISALGVGEEKWAEAINLYQAVNTGASLLVRSAAYRRLGNVLHLLTQDMAQPGHTQDDPHAPHWMFGDDAPLENKAEAWALNDQFPLGMRANFEGSLSGQNFSSPLTFGSVVANFSHAHSQFTGTLDRDNKVGHLTLPGGTSGGGLTEFSAIYSPGIFIPGPNSDNPIFESAHWDIDTGSTLLTYYPDIQGDGVLLQPLIQDWWLTPGSANQFYIDRQNEVTLLSGEKLDEYLIKTCAPVGINYGAGLIKLFHDIVNEPPYIKDLVIEDSSGASVYQTSVQPSGTRRSVQTITPESKLKFDEIYRVRITFSEPVSNVEFNSGFENVFLDDGSMESDANGMWEAAFTIPKPEPGTSSSCNEKISFTINALDRHNHLGMNGGAQLDQNPETVALRGVNEPYPWTGYETSAGVISFSAPCDCDIDRVNPIVRLDPLRECFTSNSVEIRGRATDSCKLESVKVDGIPALVGKDGAFSATVTLSDGPHTVMIEAKDSQGNTASQSVSFRIDTQPPRLVSFSPTDREKDVRLTAPVVIEYDEELSAGEIIITNASGRSIRQGHRIIYEHLPFRDGQAYSVNVVGVKDTCGCAIK